MLTAIAAGSVVYAAAVWVLRVPEARQIRRLLVGRGGSEAGPQRCHRASRPAFLERQH